MRIKFTWGHGVIIALVAFMSFILTLIFIYARMPETFDLVTEDYYEEEIKFQDEIDAYKAADALKDSVTIKVDEMGVTIKFPKEFNNANTKGTLQIYHPSKKMLDIKKDLQLNEDNAMIVPSKVLSPAIYTFKIKWRRDNINYRKDFEVRWK